MTSQLTNLIVGTALAVLGGASIAQAPALTRTVVTKADVSVPGREAIRPSGELDGRPAEMS